MPQDTKGPRPMRPDLDLHVRTDWTLTSPSGQIRRRPFTSGQNEPMRTHPEQEFTLYAPGTSGPLGERGEPERKVFVLLMRLVVMIRRWKMRGDTPNSLLPRGVSHEQPSSLTGTACS